MNKWNDINKRRKYLDELAVKLNIQQYSDWYKIRRKDLKLDDNGRSLYKVYQKYYIHIITLAYPEYDWLDWLFREPPKEIWEHVDPRKFMRWLTTDILKYDNYEDWHKITRKDIVKNGGRALFYKFGDRVSSIITALYPNYNWKLWLFDIGTPANFWSNDDNCRAFLEWLANKFGFKSKNEWYAIKNKDILRYSAGKIVRPGDSLIDTFIRLYPDINWDYNKFYQLPRNYWKDINNQKQYLERFYLDSGYTTMEDWYKCDTRTLCQHDKSALTYIRSIPRILKKVYPDYNWCEWKFKTSTRGFWENKDNHRRYMDWLFNELGYSDIEDWYKIKAKDFNDNFGRSVLKYYGCSIIKTVISVYPNYNWQLWRFYRRAFKHFVNSSFWSIKENRNQYLVWLSDKLGFNKIEDWYGLSLNILKANNGYSLYRYFNSVIGVVLDYIPDYDWDISRFGANLKSQRIMYRLIKQKYKDAKWEYRHPDLIYDKTGNNMKVDVWIPSENLVIEYMGQQHYYPVDIFGGEKGFIQNVARDREKRLKCSQKDINLLEVHYNWDQKSDSLFLLIDDKLNEAKLLRKGA